MLTRCLPRERYNVHSHVFCHVSTTAMYLCSIHEADDHGADPTNHSGMGDIHKFLQNISSSIRQTQVNSNSRQSNSEALTRNSRPEVSEHTVSVPLPSNCNLFSMVACLRALVHGTNYLSLRTHSAHSPTAVINILARKQ
jgi:hypothetical protein